MRCEQCTASFSSRQVDLSIGHTLRHTWGVTSPATVEHQSVCTTRLDVQLGMIRSRSGKLNNAHAYKPLCILYTKFVSCVEWRGPTLGTGNWLSSTCVSAISVTFNDQLQSKSNPNPNPTLQLSNPSITHPNSLQTLNTHLFILYISLLCLSVECFPAFLLSI